ncbi:MAG: type II toxin-antitoxin system RelE/ParE family toxin [Gemmatimonadales bacterium]
MSLPRPLVWSDSTRAKVRAFPELVRAKVGYELFRIQRGEMPSDWKPMQSVGPGVIEVRIHADGEYRLLLLVQLKDAITVLHAFRKRSRRTSGLDLALARKRLRDLRRFHGNGR